MHGFLDRREADFRDGDGPAEPRIPDDITEVLVRRDLNIRAVPE
jgi:hypothetical protein